MDIYEIEKAIIDWCEENPKQRGVYFAAAEFTKAGDPDSVRAVARMGGDFYKIVPTIAQSMEQPEIAAAINYAADMFEDTIKPDLARKAREKKVINRNVS